MPGIQLYQSERDEEVLVAAALSNGCWLVPDLDYASSEVDHIKTLEEFQTVRKRERHFFILHESFLRLPSCLRKIVKNGKTVFYVSPTEGGPFLEFLGGGLFTDEVSGQLRIRPGFLEYRSSYWDHAITQKEPSPPELTEAFKKLSRVVRSNSTRIKPGKSVYWLGNDAKEKLNYGAKLVGLEDWSLLHSERS